MGLPLDGASLSTIKAFSLTSQNEKKTIICVNGGAGALASLDFGFNV